MHHQPLQGLGGMCIKCEKEWQLFVVEWPPKVVVCPTCMILISQDESEGSALFKFHPYFKRSNHDE